MGLIKALTSSVGSVARDQWLEYFACDSMDNETLIKRGVKITKGNNKGTDDIISNGSIISVNEGQVAIIVSDGKIVEFTAEPGAFKWDRSTEPSLFCGGFFRGLIDSFKKVGTRFTFGGDPGKIQRVYFVNTKEIMNNKFGTSTPMPYDDPYYKTALYIRYFGQYSFKITDPLIFYAALAGNVTESYSRSQLESMATDEFMTALDTSLALCAQDGIKFSQLPIKQREIAKFMSETLDEEWAQRRGVQIVSVAISKVTPDENSRKRIEEFDTNVMHSDSRAMAGGLAYAQMQAMQNAAKNDAGAMTGFMGLGMAANVMGGATSGAGLVDAARQMEAERAAAAPATPAAPAGAAAPAADTWTCECGAKCTGKFCPECGKPKPEVKDDGWTCECGAHCTGKFCPECGKPKPAAPTKFVCECGYESDAPFKFCPSCGKKQ